MKSRFQYPITNNNSGSANFSTKLKQCGGYREKSLPKEKLYCPQSSIRFSTETPTVPDLVLPMDGDEWQNWANQLLTERYSPTNYVKIPDTEGDGGLEGFTRKEGHAFQSYGAESGKTAKQLYEAQRNKMTDDINKFINNRQLLSKLLGQTKITCWTLFVPRQSLKDLVAHANVKTQEVLAATLPYVAPGFYVTICDEEHFASERETGCCRTSQMPSVLKLKRLTKPPLISGQQPTMD